MGQLRFSQVVSDAVFYLLTLNVPHYRSLLLAGLGKAICFLLLAALLMFLVVRSADICKAITADLHVVPLSWFAPLRDHGSLEPWSRFPVMPAEPSLSPFSPRPPPIFSL